MREGNRGNFPGGVEMRKPRNEIDSVQVLIPEESDKRDIFTGETAAQMLARDQATQQEAFSTWWVLVVGLPILLYVILTQGRPKL